MHFLSTLYLYMYVCPQSEMYLSSIYDHLWGVFCNCHVLLTSWCGVLGVFSICHVFLTS